MKKILFTVLVGLFLFGGGNEVKSKQKETKWLKFDEACIAQDSSKKIIILNFYASHCGWCRRMNTNTYGDSLVAEIIEKDFLPVIIDIRSKDTLHYKGKTYAEREFAALFNIRGTPTTGFMDTTKNLIVKVPGYVPPENFVYLLKYVKGGWYKDMTYDEFYRSEKELEKQRR